MAGGTKYSLTHYAKQSAFKMVIKILMNILMNI